VVVVREQKMVIKCRDYSQAVKWARIECKAYKVLMRSRSSGSTEGEGKSQVNAQPADLDARGRQTTAGVV